MAKSKSKAVLGPWAFFNFVLLSFVFIAIFVGAFLIQRPKKAKSTQAYNTVESCGFVIATGETDWDPKRYVEIDFDDSFYGPLTDQYFAGSGTYFEYDLRKGIGLYKVSADNPLNPGNGYARTITATEPWSYPLPGTSLNESSLFLSFPNPVEKVRFQLQYDEPFDLLDIDREVPLWSVMVKVCDEEYRCRYAVPDKLSLYTHNEEPLVSMCWMGNRSHTIKTLEVRIEKDINDTTGALPPPKLTLDNIRVQPPKHWEAPTVAPTLAPVDPGTCECPEKVQGKVGDELTVDNCNSHDDYRISDCDPVCVCDRTEY